MKGIENLVHFEVIVRLESCDLRRENLVIVYMTTQDFISYGLHFKKNSKKQMSCVSHGVHLPAMIVELVMHDHRVEKNY